MVILAARKGGKVLASAFPPTPLDAYHTYVPVWRRPLDIAYTSLSLVFGM